MDEVLAESLRCVMKARTVSMQVKKKRTSPWKNCTNNLMRVRLWDGMNGRIKEPNG